MVDSGDVFNTAIAGGKVGVLTFGRSNVIWSNLLVTCKER